MVQDLGVRAQGTGWGFGVQGSEFEVESFGSQV
jgi:hypothetical protein